MSNLINEKLVKLNLNSKTRDEAIVELAKMIEAEDRLISYDEYIEEVFNREEMSTTGIGLNIAIPHGKCDAVKTPTVALGRNKDGIEWESLDGEPVNIIFLLAVPSAGDGCNDHLRILAAISRKLLHEEFTSKLHSCQSEKEMVELITSVI
ncbi:MAG: fructose PTS transporter subunit IIA [Clostridiaceae bacterium]